MVISKKTVIFQGFRGGPTFSRVGPAFSRGVQMLISIGTHKTCDFPGGVLSPYPLSESMHGIQVGVCTH